MRDSSSEKELMQRDKFPPGVSAKLKWYVYRLIDPRNGETFYVGKGRGDRIFQHAKAELKSSDDDADLKLSRIRSIRWAGLEVGHVIHRHNIDSEQIAFQIESALIDAYPGLTNLVGGHDSGDYGCRHVEQLIAEYTAEPFVAAEPLILISIAKTFGSDGMDVYTAVRAAWRIKKTRAESHGRLVLAHCQGVVVGVFRPVSWMDDTKDNFPWLPSHSLDRCGFEGQPAETEIEKHYIQKRVPDHLRRKGAANPVRFVEN
jgi:hypothetical protein